MAPGKGMGNIDDVAHRAGVSAATVSRVLREADCVRAPTRARVVDAIQKLKYCPNLSARNLARGSDCTIGVIVSNLENPFYLDIYRAVESCARSQGYEVIVANTDYQPDQLIAGVRLMIGRRVAGLAAIVSEMAPAAIEELRQAQIPVAFYDRANCAGGVEQIVKYLRRLGHRKFGFVGHHASLGPMRNRWNTLRKANGRSAAVPLQIAEDADSMEGGRRAARALIAGRIAPTALICANDVMAVGVLRELREHGVRVPLDVSVTGFDDVALSRYCHPTLTTVRVPRDRIGGMLCDSLLAKTVPRGAIRQTIEIEPELIVRESTGPAPGSRLANRMPSC